MAEDTNKGIGILLGALGVTGLIGVALRRGKRFLGMNNAVVPTDYGMVDETNSIYGPIWPEGYLIPEFNAEVETPFIYEDTSGNLDDIENPEYITQDVYGFEDSEMNAKIGRNAFIVIDTSNSMGSLTEVDDGFNTGRLAAAVDIADALINAYENPKVFFFSDILYEIEDVDDKWDIISAHNKLTRQVDDFFDESINGRPVCGGTSAEVIDDILVWAEGHDPVYIITDDYSIISANEGEQTVSDDLREKLNKSNVSIIKLGIGYGPSNW